ncbi:hypothetical protein ACT3TD_12240 [Corynebacterium sp. AOP36-E1-14]|uniref:hypothetical protein n=1 Tax=Corynebacterium sp. AOP36-E1-14 TaxID=3457682 RepID=UPI0040335994
MNPLTARVPCTARTKHRGDEQFEESALTIRPWLPGAAHELGVILRRGAREYLLSLKQAHELADEIVDAAEAAQQITEQPGYVPRPGTRQER